MQRIMVVLVLLCGAWLPAWAEDGLPAAAERATIRDVIERQLDAFQRDDGAAAFSYASPQIQAMFGTPERFMQMVRDGYPAVYRPRSVEFQPLQRRGGRLIQPVLVIGPDGVPVLALYIMARQPDGKWRIDGCHMAAVDDMAA